MLELTLADRSYIDVRTNNKSRPDKSQALKAMGPRSLRFSQKGSKIARKQARRPILYYI